MNLSKDVADKLLEDSRKTRQTETYIMCELEYETQDPEARGAIKAVNAVVFNVLRSSRRT